MKVYLPIKIKDLYVHKKNKDVDYALLMNEYDYKKIENVITDKKLGVLVLPNFEKTLTYDKAIAKGEYSFAPRNLDETDELTIIVTGTASVRFDLASLKKCKKVNLILPNYMALFVTYESGEHGYDSNAETYYTVCEKDFKLDYSDGGWRASGTIYSSYKIKTEPIDEVALYGCKLKVRKDFYYDHETKSIEKIKIPKKDKTNIK